MTLRFGIEGEVLLARADTFEPLWHDRLDFFELSSLLESIPTADVAREGLRREGPHTSNLPYVVEGYDMPAQHDPNVALERLPKGLEIRTPVCASPAQALELYEVLFARLRRALAGAELVPVHVSHHPYATGFSGPRNSTRTDWWRWHMASMTTYGPDVNIGLDSVAFEALDVRDLRARFDFYSPALVAFSLDAPIYGGDLWRPFPQQPALQGPVGKSVRTFHRSLYAPTLLVLPDEQGRLEFKGFDTTHSLADLENDLLLFAAVLLEPALPGRATAGERVRHLREVAVWGWNAADVRWQAAAVLDSAERTLPRYGLDPYPLERYWRRLDAGWVPADRTISFLEEEGAIEGVLRQLSDLVAEDPMELELRRRRSPAPAAGEAVGR